MHKYIKRIMDVNSDDNCGYHIILAFLGKEDKNQTCVCQHLIEELMAHKESYKSYTEKNNIFVEIHESHIPCVSGTTPEAKWTCFCEIGHLIAIAYNKVCIDMTRYGL